jgi:hypothetical protein
MIVRCVENRGSALPAAYHDPAGGFGADTLFDVEPGQEYVVYAVAARDGRIGYYLCGDLHPHYPVAYPAPLFLITRDELSRYWEIAYTPNNRDHQLILSFHEWVSDAYFYDRLTDLHDRDVEIFHRMRVLIDGEHRGPGGGAAGG